MFRVLNTGAFICLQWRGRHKGCNWSRSNWSDDWLPNSSDDLLVQKQVWIDPALPAERHRRWSIIKQFSDERGLDKQWRRQTEGNVRFWKSTGTRLIEVKAIRHKCCENNATIQLFNLLTEQVVMKSTDCLNSGKQSKKDCLIKLSHITGVNI